MFPSNPTSGGLQPENYVIILILISYWHECAVFQSVGIYAVDLVAITANIFIIPPLPPTSRPFLIEGVLGSKNLFSESCLECPKTWG